MKRTICEKLMWSAMTPTIFEYIASEFQNIDLAGKKKEAKRIYLDMVKRTTFRLNSWAACYIEPVQSQRERNAVIFMSVKRDRSGINSFLYYQFACFLFCLCHRLFECIQRHA